MKTRRLLASVCLAVVGFVACSGSQSSSGFGDGPDGSSAAGDGGGGDGFGGFDSGPGFDGSFHVDSSMESGLSDGSLVSDALPEVGDGACVAGDAGPPPFPQRCTAATSNECAGATDTALTSLGVSSALLNGTTGNGFDDDCDGLVDEGCVCPGNGQTKDCYLVPATQVNPATKQPVGWCTQNSKGSLDCSGTEFPTWSGTCRGAQPPYPDDVCAPGDFNCDGLPENSHAQDCTCKTDPVQCPTNPIVEHPYPDPANIPIVDGTTWFTQAGAVASSTNWTWTVIGGDCDNVLPFPTYAIYNQTNSTAAGARKGARTAVSYNAAATPARYVADPTSKLVSIQAASYGNGVAGAKIYPAFGLSGDYIVQGEFDYNSKHYVCTQKVQVRAPGIRAELCWDTVGGDESANAAGNDIDLHFARLQGVTCAKHGWEDLCGTSSNYQDCWYNPSSGCRDTSSTAPAWGYASSADSACLGWSSKRNPNGTLKCTNPRLDKDNITCDKTVDDPTNTGSGFAGGFCGPENINLDNPKDGDTFAVAVNHYANHGGTSNAKPHVNLYCNGARVISVGYNPVTAAAWPTLITGGDDTTGDYWIVGTIKSHVDAQGNVTSCDVATVPSHHADPTRDGPPGGAAPNDGNALCVESKMNKSSAVYNYVDHEFVDHSSLQGPVNGSVPSTPAQFCKH
jgi:hypothetical protein